MTHPEIRPHIVALLCDADFKYRPDTNTWSHRDGRPFSNAEQATAHQGTRAELEEVQAQFTRYRAYLSQEQEAPEAFQRFLAPFMERLTEKNLGNAVDLMSQDERAEFDRLLKLMVEPVRPFAAYTF